MFCTGFVLSGTKLLNRGNNNPMVLSGLSLSGTTEGVFSFSPTVGRYVNIRQVARYRRLFCAKLKSLEFMQVISDTLYKVPELHCKCYPL